MGGLDDACTQQQQQQKLIWKAHKYPSTFFVNIISFNICQHTHILPLLHIENYDEYIRKRTQTGMSACVCVCLCITKQRNI